MASNKDILEAQRFNRRRLVTAFSSGTPRGRELESRSPLRPMIVGAVLVVVMVAAAAVMGRFSPRAGRTRPSSSSRDPERATTPLTESYVRSPMSPPPTC